MKAPVLTPITNGRAAESLRAVMAEHGLRARDVAELCCVSLKTVESWLANPEAASFRSMSPRHLRSLAFALPAFLGKRRTVEKRKQKGKK
jgi:uncharacterized protein (DUF2267 family)